MWSCCQDVYTIKSEQEGKTFSLPTDRAPAAPEPMASRLRFYEDDELQQIAEEAGFARATVVRRDLLPFAQQAGVPEEHLVVFAGPGAPFLLAQKD